MNSYQGSHFVRRLEGVEQTRHYGRHSDDISKQGVRIETATRNYIKLQRKAMLGLPRRSLVTRTLKSPIRLGFRHTSFSLISLQQGFTPMHVAAANGQDKMVEYLHKNSIGDVNAKASPR